MVALIIMDSIIAATAVVSGLPPTNIHHHSHFFHRICSMSIMNKKIIFHDQRVFFLHHFSESDIQCGEFVLCQKKNVLFLAPVLELRSK